MCLDHSAEMAEFISQFRASGRKMDTPENKAVFDVKCRYILLLLLLYYYCYYYLFSGPLRFWNFSFVSNFTSNYKYFCDLF